MNWKHLPLEDCSCNSISVSFNPRRIIQGIDRNTLLLKVNISYVSSEDMLSKVFESRYRGRIRQAASELIEKIRAHIRAFGSAVVNYDQDCVHERSKQNKEDTGFQISQLKNFQNS